ADIEQRTPRLDWTPLITAASEWNPVAVEALLMAGADVGAKTSKANGVYGVGSDCFDFAKGHEATLAVLRRYQ
ncbi:MAG: hypothetical protein AAFP78_14585, partial [Pseudomonadota bacterium]